MGIVVIVAYINHLEPLHLLVVHIIAAAIVVDHITHRSAADLAFEFHNYYFTTFF